MLIPVEPLGHPLPADRLRRRAPMRVLAVDRQPAEPDDLA
jgi:hypothetical protein